MLDHLGVQCDDVPASKAFYTRLLAPLGVAATMDYGVAVGFAGPDGNPRFWVGASEGGTQREVHIAFTAPDRSAVHAVHDAAVQLDAEILHEPREWPEYHDGYFAVFLRDLDGNNVEAVCHWDPSAGAGEATS